MSDPSVVVLPPPAEPQKIAILGAGMAGLSAAEILVNAGHDVTVFEAQVRPGGRILTSRQNFAEGLHVELGASRFPDCHHLTLAYCRRMGLTLVDFGSEDLKPLLALDGHRVRDSGPLPASLGLPPAEQGLTLQELENRYLQPLLDEIGDPLAPDWPAEHLLEYDDLSYTELLLKRGASKKTIGLIGTGFNVGEGLDGASALWMLRNHKLDRTRNRLHKLKEGNDRLPQVMALRLSACIRYGTQVIALKQDRGGVEVGYLKMPVGRFSERFDRVVCTLPFPLVRDLEVFPAFSAGKRRALRELPYASMVKVLLQTRRRFWMDLGLSGFVTTDLPMTEIWNVTLGEEGTRGVLLAYLGGYKARNLTYLSEFERLARVLHMLKKVLPELEEHYEGGMTWSWDTAPWARGAGAWYAMRQIRTLYPHVATPEGRIHFAGEHTSPWPGWVQGALHSGQRVAREVNELGP